MPSAEEVATFLGFEFLTPGNFAVSTGPIQIPAIVEAIAAREHRPIEPGEFGSISVQAVGFEEGNETPKVHIYLTRGSVRLIKSLPRDVGGVQLMAHKMGPIKCSAGDGWGDHQSSAHL